MGCALRVVENTHLRSCGIGDFQIQTEKLVITNQLDIVLLTQIIGTETNINLEEEKCMERKDDQNHAESVLDCILVY